VAVRVVALYVTAAGTTTLFSSRSSNVLPVSVAAFSPDENVTVTFAPPATCCWPLNGPVPDGVRCGPACMNTRASSASTARWAARSNAGTRLEAGAETGHSPSGRTGEDDAQP
jgi:hypothetical protein